MYTFLGYAYELNIKPVEANPAESQNHSKQQTELRPTVLTLTQEL